MLPESRGKTYITRVLSIYVDLFRNKYGFVPQIAFAKWGMMLKRLMESHTELQISAMLIVFFNWQGMDGGSDFERDKLIEAGHPFGWFFNNPNVYEIYLRNVFKLEMDDEEKVKEFVAKSMLELNN